MVRTVLFPLLFAAVLVGGCDTPQSRIEQYVAAEKSNLPRREDNNIFKIDIQAKDREIENIFEVRGLSDAAAISRKAMVEQRTTSRIRTNLKTIPQLIDYKIKMTFVYRNKAGDELFRFTVQPWEL